MANQMTNAGISWSFFYYTLAAGAALELVGGTVLFWGENAATFRANNAKTNEAKGNRTVEALKSRTTLLMAVFLFVYMGVEGLHPLC